MSGNVYAILLYALPAVLAITLHEAAHGFVALFFGDPTAKERGRLTLNPIKHMDPVGTVILPGMLILLGAPFLFGWAKPVPVTVHRLRHPKLHMVWVALAGPMTNFILAAFSALAIGALHRHGGQGLMTSALIQSLVFSIHINVILGIFNMLPIPPLDGGRVLAGLLPRPLDRGVERLEPYGFAIIFGLFFLMPAAFGRVHPLFSFFSQSLMTTMTWVKKTLFIPMTGFM